MDAALSHDRSSETETIRVVESTAGSVPIAHYLLVCSVGKAVYENGAVYEGDFQKDHRWGWGLQRFPDGSTYEGEWFDDIIEGERVSLKCQSE